MTDESTLSEAEAEFRDHSKEGGRVKHAAVSESFESTLADAIEEAESGGSSTVGFRDASMFALLETLDEHPSVRENLANTLFDALGRDGDPEEVSRSELSRLLFRAALEEYDPKLLGALVEAKRKQVEP